MIGRKIGNKVSFSFISILIITIGLVGCDNPSNGYDPNSGTGGGNNPPVSVPSWAQGNWYNTSSGVGRFRIAQITSTQYIAYGYNSVEYTRINCTGVTGNSIIFGSELKPKFLIKPSKEGKGGRRYLPYVFSEHGVLMLSSVLNSKKAINVNIEIMVTFIKMCQYVFLKADQMSRLLNCENSSCFIYIEKNDKRVNEIIVALNNLIQQSLKTKTIGFRTGE